jgi:formate dehydrogenase major subunit
MKVVVPLFVAKGVPERLYDTAFIVLLALMVAPATCPVALTLANVSATGGGVDYGASNASNIQVWNGTNWVGYDVPDIVPTAKPDLVGPFIMNPEGTARLFVRGLMRDGPFPAHYEPFEAPIANVIAPKIRGNPAARVFRGDLEQFGDAKEFPYAATSYRLTEHFHFWTKHAKINAILQPEEFIEIGEALAKEKGIGQGEWVKLSSNRGFVVAKAYVTKRLKPMMVDGKPVHTIGMPIHWGFTGAARKGFGANVLTPFVGDANAETPEFKAFLVNVEKAAVPVA